MNIRLELSVQSDRSPGQRLRVFGTQLLLSYDIFLSSIAPLAAFSSLLPHHGEPNIFNTILVDY
ncbi:hypothetical protein GBA52_009371 [Prunus armeniaca]|nr:hypothetical protein GBA52_009371 [Prunus armeniaca]